MKVDVIGSPFEADHMQVSLANQGIIDFAQSKDADLTTCGAGSESLHSNHYSK